VDTGTETVRGNEAAERPGEVALLPPKTPIRVLILEDNEADATLMVHELGRAGYQPEWTRVETEKGFLDGLSHNPDIILSDSNLPQFRGVDARIALRQRGLQIPLIVVSGAAQRAADTETTLAGASGYLYKGHLRRLGELVREVLGSGLSERKPQVWVVDEGPDKGRALAFCLQTLGFRARMFESAQSALTAMTPPATLPMLLVADLKGLEQGGTELLNRCQEGVPKVKTLGLGSTWETGDLIVPTSLPNVVLKKPFDYHELLSAVANVLN